MAWANFTAQFNYDRRPKQAVAFAVQPGLRQLPRDVIAAAVAAGRAVSVDPPPRSKKPKELTNYQGRVERPFS